ncbi:MAG: hypothetical protein U5K84_11510 [Alkalibacterium sp.]|nr:hypothetical protein [Alkalibacterium sp.]
MDVLWKKTDQELFEEHESRLTIHISPDEGFEMQLNGKEIGPGMHLRPVTLQSIRSEETIEESPEAYEKLLLDVLEGDETNFAHWGEVAASWKYIDHIRQAWDESDKDISFYPAHTMGPKEADDLLALDGQKWICDPKD